MQRFDLSLRDAPRHARTASCVRRPPRCRETGLGVKAATITPEDADDVGSPNRILREEIGGTVIVRTGRRIPGITPVAGVHDPISICRMAVGDAYGAEEWREQVEGDELARRTETIRRSHCRAVAEYAFRAAERMGGRVYGGPKWTVSPVYEGMLKEEMDAAAERHPRVAYEPVLIDATLAGLVSGAASSPLVVPCLNRDGDLLSDLVLPLFGSIAGAESVLLALDRRAADHGGDGGGAARHRPGAAGQGHREPDGDDPRLRRRSSTTRPSAGADGAERRSRAVYESVLEATAAGVRTPDLGGHAGTTEFTDEVIARVRTKLEAWSSLGTAV